MTLYHKSNLQGSLSKKLLFYLFLFILVITLLLSLTGCGGKTGTDVGATFTTTQITTTIVVNNIIASVQSMSISNGYPQSFLVVHLIPSSLAIADKEYTVVLYEKGNYKDAITVSWNQPEIDVSETVEVKFPISQTEEAAYDAKDVSGVFSIKVIAYHTASSTLPN